MSIKKSHADVDYQVPVSTPPDQDVKSSLVQYTGEVIMHQTFIHLVDEDTYIPWDKVFSVTELEE